MRRLGVVEVWYAEIQRQPIAPQPLRPLKLFLMDLQEFQSLRDLVEQVGEIIVAEHQRTTVNVLESVMPNGYADLSTLSIIRCK
jgi:hypothetical protein